MTRTVFLIFFSFLAGAIVRHELQDRWDAQAKAELGRLAYTCVGYYVADKHGDHECRALQPRAEFAWPVPNPTKLRRKDIKKAIRG